MKRIDFERYLKKNNCKLKREGGNHSVYFNALNNKQAAVPRHRELNKFTIKAICEELRIPFALIN